MRKWKAACVMGQNVHTSNKAEIAKENSMSRVSEKQFCLFAITFNSPKASVTGSKQVPRKEIWGPIGLETLYQNF